MRTQQETVWHVSKKEVVFTFHLIRRGWNHNTRSNMEKNTSLFCQKIGCDLCMSLTWSANVVIPLIEFLSKVEMVRQRRPPSYISLSACAVSRPCELQLCFVLVCTSPQHFYFSSTGRFHELLVFQNNRSSRLLCNYFPPPSPAHAFLPWVKSAVCEITARMSPTLFYYFDFRCLGNISKHLNVSSKIRRNVWLGFLHS